MPSAHVPGRVVVGHWWRSCWKQGLVLTGDWSYLVSFIKGVSTLDSLIVRQLSAIWKKHYRRQQKDAIIYNLSCKGLESSVETNSFSFLRWLMWRQISWWLRGGFTHIVWSLLFLRIRVGPRDRFVKGGGSVWRVTKAGHMTRWPPCSSRKQRVCTTLPLCIMLIYAQDDLKSEDNFWHSWLETYLSPMSFITWLTSLQLFFPTEL